MSVLRQVHRLRLRAPDATLAGRARLLLEDALCTASLPGNGGRVVLVRTLEVGRFAADISPAALARLIERRVAQLGSDMIYAGAPNADTAPAVWFHDHLDAHLSLARRVAENSRVDAWFWPRAVPDWRPSATLPEQLRAITLSLARLPEAPTALRVFVRELARLGHADRLIASTTPADVSSVLVANGVQLIAAISADRARLMTRSPRSPEAESVGDLPGTALAATDSRRRRLNTVLASDRSAGSDRRVNGKPADDDAAATFAVTNSATAARTLGPRRHTQSEPTPVTISRLAPAARVHDSAATVQVTTTSQAQRDEPGRVSTCLDTRAGGLLLLLPVLTRLGLPRWLEASPDWAEHQILPALLTYICRSLGIPADDPAWLLGAAADTRAAPTSFCAPAVWMEGIAQVRGALHLTSAADHRLWDASGRLLLAAWATQEQCVQSNDLALNVARAWVTACRRWLRPHARIGLADLVLRPAKLSLTPTHADVYFDPSNVSLPVRRAGLDFDPGWLPWFGRIVSFHYERLG
jgi:hypothetical protein